MASADGGLERRSFASSCPAFKGTPGWEFTPIDKLDLAQFPAAAAAGADAEHKVPVRARGRRECQRGRADL